MKYIRVFLSENFQFLEVKFSIYLNRRVFVMRVRGHVSISSLSTLSFTSSPFLALLSLFSLSLRDDTK